MLGISYEKYPMRAGQTKYQTENKNKKNNGNHGFGTKLINGEYYIHVARDENVRNYPTFPEVDKIPSKYALKDNKSLGRHWRAPGIEYRFFHAAESTEENPVLVARGVDEHGKLFEEKIDVKQINPYNTTHLEIVALSYFKPGEHHMIVTPFGSDGIGLQDRFDFITDYQRDIRACKRLRLSKEAAWLQEEVDFLLSFTNGSARPNKIGSAYTVDADSLVDFANDNSRYLELYSSAVRDRMISDMTRRCNIKIDPWQILQNKYPDVVFHVGDIAMFDKNNLIPYRQGFPVSKLFEKDADLEKLALWRPKTNSDIPTGFEDYIQADRARIPKGTRAVMIHPDVKDRMEKDIQYANDILSKVDDFFQKEIMINEELIPGSTLGMNQFVAVDADGKIGYNCSVTHGTNSYEEPWQKNITPSLIREIENLYKEVDITSKSGAIQPEDKSYKLNMEENDYTEDYQSILGIASEEMWKKKYLERRTL